MKAHARMVVGWLAVFVLAGPAAAGPVREWNELMLDAIRADSTAPTISTRHLAMLNAAMHDAVNSVTGKYQPYRSRLPVAAGASAEAAAEAAGYEVFALLYPSLAPWAVDLHAAYLAANPESEAQTAGLAVGRQVAWGMVDSRAVDGANTEVPYVPSDLPGAWQRTPPFFRPPLTPHWRWVQPFCLPSVEDFVPPAPPSLDSAEYAESVREVWAVGGSRSAVRTAYQSETAVFWSDFSYTAMPPGHWHEITLDLAAARAMDLAGEARLMALLSLALADAAIVCWEAKYRYNLWRPYTAIRRSAEDGNPSTAADSAWESRLAAPPFPAYPSGHSTFSGAAVAVLQAVFGTDGVVFTARSDSLPGVVRTYTSLAACAEEVGLSRVYGGIHFPFDNEAGKASGRRIGQHVAGTRLLPNQGLPLLAWEVTRTGRRSIRVHGGWDTWTVVEESSPVAPWHPVVTNRAVAGGWEFVPPPFLRPDTSPSGGRFYRVRMELSEP